MREKETACRQAIPETNVLYTAPSGCIAILMATYNGAKFLKEQLESLRAQTFQNFICYIHDDGSKDGTQEITEKYCERYSDHFICMGSFPTGGAKCNFMYMLKNVAADYYMFCDQDDVWLPEKIEKTFQKMRQTENEKKSDCPICLFSDVIVADERLNVLDNSFYTYSGINQNRIELVDLLYQNLAPGCTMMINRLLRDNTLLVDVMDLIRMHDWYLVLIAKSIGYLERIKEPLMYYRQHDNNAIGVQKNMSLGQKLKHVFGIKLWLEEKRQFFKTRENNAKAVLACIDAGNSAEIKNTEQLHKRFESAEVIKKFIRQQNYPLVLKLVIFYRWKLGDIKP